MGTLAIKAVALMIASSGLCLRSTAQTINPVSVVQYGAKCDGRTDDSVALQSAIKAVAINGGVLQIPAARCNHASTLTRPRNVRIQGQGASVSTLSYMGSAHAWVIGDSSSPQNGMQGGFSSLTLNGPGYTGSTVGVYLGADPAGVVSPAGNYANNEYWQNVNIDNFGLGVQVGNNAYLFSCDGCIIFNNGQHWKDGGTASNSGERMVFTKSVLGQSRSVTLPAVELDNNIGDYYFDHTSFDYNNTSQADIQCLAGGMHATFTSDHFEKLHGEYIHINNTVCNGEIHVFGGEFSTTGTGTTDNDMIGLSGIYRSQNVVSVFGAAVNSNEALSAFVDADSPSRQVTLDSLDYENYGNLPSVPVNARGNPLGITVRNTQNVASIIGDAATTFSEPVSLGSSPAPNNNSAPLSAPSTGVGTTTMTTGPEGNASIGDSALVSCATCSSATSVGQGSLSFMTNGTGVSALGYDAGAYISGGLIANVAARDSLYLGAYSYPLASGDNNENVIGNKAVGHGSNTTTVGDSGILETYLQGVTMPATIYSATGTALPPCAESRKGALAVVSDAARPAYMEPYTGGGAITAVVICSFDGTNYSWLSH
jgi:Pectate lyase superfamily protein